MSPEAFLRLVARIVEAMDVALPASKLSEDETLRVIVDIEVRKVRIG